MQTKLFVTLMLGATACTAGAGSVHYVDVGTSGDVDRDGADAASVSQMADAGVDLGSVSTPDASATLDAGPDLTPTPPGPAAIYIAESDGTIQWGTFDPGTEVLSLEGSLERGGNQRFLAFDQSGERLYAANNESVEAFALDVDGTPTFLGSADAGIGGTHLAVDATRTFAFVASYGGDAVAVLPLDPDGVPMDATMTFGGASAPDFCRRAHQIRVHPNNKFVYAPCLGSQHIATLSLDASTGTIDILASAPVAQGSGPRHMDFHPTLPNAYVIGENDDTITRLDVDDVSGALTNPVAVSTRPVDPDVLGPASDVHVSPDGKFVLGINRNPRNELVVFDVDSAGALTFRDAVFNGGEHARTFTFTPSGTHVLVGNSNSQDVVVFGFDGGSVVEGQKLSNFDARVMFVGVRP